MRKKRGVGLGTVLLVVAMVVTLGFALAGASVQHLNVQSRITNSARALDVARASANLGLERVLTDQDFGKDTSADTLLEFKDGQGAVGVLTFNPTQAAQKKIPYSLNNLTGTEVKAGSTGQVVPLKTVHLVAIGTFRNTTRKVEVALSLPPYPYAAASDGPISARQVIVGAVPIGTGAGLPPANMKLKPANLMSNASGGQALHLGEDSTVSGDLMARGGIKVDQRATVKGLVRPNQQERELPHWRTEDYDPKVLGRPYTELDGQYSAGSGSPTANATPTPTATPDPSQNPRDGGMLTGNPNKGTDEGNPTFTPTPQVGSSTATGSAVKFTGTCRRQGNLNIEGDLDVEGALVFVDGNLDVKGALLGKGVVVSTGDLTVRDHAEVDAQDKVALLAKKKLTLKGEGRSSSLITGILYSEGGFEASQLTLRGVVISREGTSGDKPVTFNGAKVIKDPTPVTVTVAPTVKEGTFSIILMDAFSKDTTMMGPLLDESYYDNAGFPTTIIEPVVNGAGESTTIEYREISLKNLLVADFVASTGNDGLTRYAVTFRPSLYTIPGWHSHDNMVTEIAKLTGMSPTTVGRVFQAAVDGRGSAAVPEVVAPSYSLTVKEPSQLLPFYQQARITFWKED